MARISLIDDPADDELAVREAFERMRAKRGKVTNIYRAMAHRPSILAATGPFVAAVQAPQELDERLKERVILRVSILNRSAYCVYAHEQISAKMGFTDAEIREMQDPGTAILDDAEQAALVFAEEVTLRPGAVSDAAFEALQRHFSEPQIVELTMLIALYNMINRFNEALRLDPEEY